MRYAHVTNASSQSQLEAYLPANYEVLACVDTGVHNGFEAVIGGNDSHGWGLDSYVIPRYASGLLWATEISPQVANVIRFEWIEEGLLEDDREPTDDDFYNRCGVEGGIGYTLGGFDD